MCAVTAYFQYDIYPGRERNGSLERKTERSAAERRWRGKLRHRGRSLTCIACPSTLPSEASSVYFLPLSHSAECARLSIGSRQQQQRRQQQQQHSQKQAHPAGSERYRRPAAAGRLRGEVRGHARHSDSTANHEEVQKAPASKKRRFGVGAQFLNTLNVNKRNAWSSY